MIKILNVILQYRGSILYKFPYMPRKSFHTGKHGGSQTLSSVARSLGLPARIANRVVGVSVDPKSGAPIEFHLDTDLKAWLRSAEPQQAQFVLDFIQCSDTELRTVATGETHSEGNPVGFGFNDIINPFAEAGGPRISDIPDNKLRRFRSEVAREVKAFFRDRKEWKLALRGGLVRSLRWAGSVPLAEYVARDWRMQFKLRAIELLANQGSKIRTCGECQQLFLLRDPRQKFCSLFCTNRFHLGKFESGLGEAGLKKKRHEYYLRRKALAARAKATAHVREGELK